MVLPILWGVLMGFALGITVSGFFWSRLCDQSIDQTTEAQGIAVRAIAQYNALDKIHTASLAKQAMERLRRKKENKDA